MKKKYAFTLAEVLLTLSIVGIVAAMTIPSLMTSIQNMDTVAKVRKAHSVLQQAVKMYEANSQITELSGSNIFNTPEEAWNAFKPYMNLSKDCGVNPNTGCFPAGVTYKLLSGLDWAIIDAYSEGKGIFTDGVSVIIPGATPSCNQDYSINNSGPLHKICANFYVDVNGIKGPNQFGRDTFVFLLSSNGNVYPQGSLDDEYNGCNKNGGYDSSDGYAAIGGGCTKKIILDGDIRY